MLVTLMSCHGTTIFFLYQHEMGTCNQNCSAPFFCYSIPNSLLNTYILTSQFYTGTRQVNGQSNFNEPSILFRRYHSWHNSAEWEKNARICNLSLFEMTFPLMISGFVLFYTLELGNEQRDERLYNGTYTKSTEWKWDRKKLHGQRWPAVFPSTWNEWLCWCAFFTWPLLCGSHHAVFQYQVWL